MSKQEKKNTTTTTHLFSFDYFSEQFPNEFMFSMS